MVNFNGPPTALDLTSHDEGRHLGVTPFSEAIMSGNDRMFQLAIGHGCLDNLEEELRFLPAMTAAAATNDLALLQELLGRVRHPRPAELTAPLLESLGNGHREAARILLDSGAMTALFRDLYYNHGINLRDALLRKDEEMVYALLDATCSEPRMENYLSEQDATERHVSVF